MGRGECRGWSWFITLPLAPPVCGGGDAVAVDDAGPWGCEGDDEEMDRACDDDGDEPYDVLPGEGCVCLFGWGVAESEGGCCRKAAKKEDKKNGRCEEGILVGSEDIWSGRSLLQAVYHPMSLGFEGLDKCGMVSIETHTCFVVCLYLDGSGRFTEEYATRRLLSRTITWKKSRRPCMFG